MKKVFTKNNGIVALMCIAVVMFATLCCSMDTADDITLVATAKINSKGGAYLRKSTSTKSAKVKLLKNNAKITINNEIFTTKKSAEAKDRWYYVTTTAGKSGYIRKDLVDSVKYTKIQMQVVPGTYLLNYRNGAGSEMTRKGSLCDYDIVSAVLKAYPKDSSELWYKIKKGSKYYYVSAEYLSTEILEKPEGYDRAGNPEFPEKVSIPKYPGTIANQINKMALHMAWPAGTPESEYGYKKGYPTREYAGIHMQWPNRTMEVSSTYGAGPKYGASCDRFVGCVIWAVSQNNEFDPEYPKGSGFKSSQQGGYMKKHPEKWEKLEYTGDTSVLMPGDIVTYSKKSDGSGAHILIVVKVDGQLAIAEAALNSTYPHINNDLNKISTKYSSYKKKAVYRAIDQ